MMSRHFLYKETLFADQLGLNSALEKNVTGIQDGWTSQWVFKQTSTTKKSDVTVRSHTTGSAEPEKKQRTNHLGLRKAAAKFLGCDRSVGDPELADRPAALLAPPAVPQRTKQIS
jgi:hypothetical protein